jgi:anti-sigma B factor antagonist
LNRQCDRPDDGSPEKRKAREMEFTVSTREEGPFTVVEVGGEVDVYTAPRLREAVVTAIESGNTRLVIDVENVEFLDSTGVGVLVGALKKVRSAGGTLDIVCTQPRLLKIFDITGLDKVFGLHTSVAEAVSTLS